MKKRRVVLILISIIIFGGFLRFYDLNWDSYGAFHPDERNISWAITRIKFFSQLNPQFFAYGGLPVYLYRALGDGIVAITHDQQWLMDWGHIAVIGRYVSATLSTISIFLLFLVSMAYFSPEVGLLSAALIAFSPWAIQQAHFCTTETMLVFFILLLLLYAKKIQKIKLEFHKKAYVHSIIILGVVWGLALAAKTTSLLFGIIPVLAIWLPHKLFTKFFRKIVSTFFLGSIAAGIFFLFSPYTILDFTHFYQSMTYESGVALGRFTVPYTLQFLHTIPYVFQLETMLWQTGPLLIVGLIGIIALLFRVKKNILFLLFPLIYFGWVGSWFAKFNRYNVPFLPFVTITAAWILIKLRNKFLVIIICLVTIAWGLANFSVYLRPQTRFVATEWIFTHIPAGAHIYTEHWNDGLPLDLPHAIPYNRELLTVYDEDNAAKKIYYADKLVAGDYIILSTRRMWATMPNLGDKYPLTKLFYARLLNGTLGYKEVATITSYPQLFGIQINDDIAEESIQVFDHPTVLIFQNVRRYTRDEYMKLLSVPSMGN